VPGPAAMNPAPLSGVVLASSCRSPQRVTTVGSA
jgi:hypothetical protein